MTPATLLIDHFPNQIDASFNADGYSNRFRDSSFIVSAAGKEVDYQSHWGILSIKSAAYGTEYYESGNGVYAVNDSNYLILNEGTYRSSHIRSQLPVHSFSISFSPKLVDSFLFSLLSSQRKLLDNPYSVTSDQLDFTEKIYEHDTLISPLLWKIKGLCRDWDHNYSMINELLSYLLEAMVSNQMQVWTSMRDIKAVKPSTQKELYKRIHRAKDYIQACYSQNLTIETLARVACLNPHYFLREFKKTLTLTPHQFLQKTRLTEAERLLITTSKNINEVCSSVGFSDPASFCKLFKSNFNQTPTNYRKNFSS